MSLIFQSTIIQINKMVGIFFVEIGEPRSSFFIHMQTRKFQSLLGTINLNCLFKTGFVSYYIITKQK